MKSGKHDEADRTPVKAKIYLRCIYNVGLCGLDAVQETKALGYIGRGLWKSSRHSSPQGRLVGLAVVVVESRSRG